MTAYDPRNMSWDYWCSLTAEQFSGNQLGVVPESEWKAWVDGLSGIGYFTQSGVPDSRTFSSWQEWAENFVGIMNLIQPKI